MNIAPVSMMNYNTNFGKIKKQTPDYSNNGAGENVPQPGAEKKEQPAVTWHNYGGFAYPVEHKPEPEKQVKDDSRFNKF